MLKEDLKKYLAEKKGWKCPAQVYGRYTSYGCIQYLLKQCSSWVLDTGLVGMKCHTEQLNIRIAMA